MGLNEDPVNAIPNSVQSYLPNKHQLKIRKDREIDNDIFKECKQTILKELVKLRKNRDPNSRQWKTGIHTFICGGGSETSFYTDAVNDVHDWWANNNISGLKISSLPKPQNFEAKNLKESDYHRLAVVYALSIPEFNIGERYAPNEIDDITPLARKGYEDNLIYKDQV